MLAVAVCMSVGACGKGESNDPVGPTNQQPFILSTTVFPPSISPGESTIVVINAMDPDADTLWYDWITDSRLLVKGARPGEPFLYDTRENFHVFYHANLNRTYPDTTWIQCFARDGHGKSDNRVVHVILQP